jgi:hypothetical protein
MTTTAFMAMCAILATERTPPAERRGGSNFGVDIYDLLLESANTSDVARLTFFQDGNPPESIFPI